MSLVLSYIFLLLFVRVSICLRVTGIKVPEIKQRGEDIILECEFELEGRLYSVKWYKDNEEFYRYMPLLRPTQHAHKLEGVIVDLEMSNERRVQLRNLTLRSRGNYRCEVSEEAPSFHSDQAESFMEVYYFPRESPVISGHTSLYKENEPLDVNCTSAKAFPAPELQWRINGEKIFIRSWLSSYGSKPAPQGLLTTTIGLHAPAKRGMTLRCIASIGTLRRERTVVIETNTAHKCKTEDNIIRLTLLLIWYTYKIS